ncbi:Glyco-hydro-cc domain-containing protein [Favolaschia claudopus]|uniref:Glyco-hydro-cc domain-containing protein n=1 Tax=Favolaschia claudopus TaxID=2862362 RepID=A0AAW0DCR5_9AGAR
MPLIMTLTTLSLLLFLSFTAVSARPSSRTVSVTSSSKAGIAGGGDGETDMKQFTTTGKVSWYYTWSLFSIDNTDLEFVPMLWGEKDISQWTDASDGINATISKTKPAAILAMNEPQEKGQSNLTPQQGADMWKTYLEPLRAQGIRLGSPAPSSAPSGKTWIQDFLTACNGGCTVDFIALHWYDVNATKFINYLNDFHDTFQRPIWVTEWACQNFNNGPQCTAPQVAQLLEQTQGFMDSTDWVERYSWFGIMRDLQGVNTLDAMMTTKGDITDLGKQYIGSEPAKTSGAPPSGTGGSDPGLPGLPTGAATSLMTPRWWALPWGMVPILLFALLL